MFLALHESRGDRRAGFFQSFFKKKEKENTSSEMEL